MRLFKREKAKPAISAHYVLYPGAFREEFEQEGKTAFYVYLRPTDAHFRPADGPYIRQTAILAEVLCQGFTVHALESGSCWSRDVYGVQALDHFALRHGSDVTGKNGLADKRAQLEKIAALSILSDYDHAVWTILLGEGYPYELLKKRLQVFCDKMGVPLQIRGSLPMG